MLSHYAVTAVNLLMLWTIVNKLVTFCIFPLGISSIYFSLMHCTALGVILRCVKVINYVYVTLKSLNQFSRMNNNKKYISLHQHIVCTDEHVPFTWINDFTITLRGHILLGTLYSLDTVRMWELLYFNHY